jgi:hypothetical protein
MISSDFEDRLREEMRQATAGVSPPSGLVRQARRAGRRRLTVGAAAAAATAAAVAVAVVVTTGAVGAPQDAGIYTTAYVVKHVESALGTAATVDDIEYLHATDGYRNSWLYNGPQGVLMRTSVSSSPHGQPTAELGISQTSAGTTFTTVDYQPKTWVRRTGPPERAAARPPASCGDTMFTIIGYNNQDLVNTQQPAIPMNWGSYFVPGPDSNILPLLTENIRQAFACGQLIKEGTEHVNGVDAIKLVSVRTSPVLYPKGPTITMITTLWVDPVTYLPVRWKFVSDISHQPATQGGTFDITWLAPTRANLAQLTVQIPPGFTQLFPPH